MKAKILQIKVTSEANRVTIDKAIQILKSARNHDPDAEVDVVIYHVVKEVRKLAV